MGLGGISIWQLLIVLAIVIMIFGTKRLRGLGSDLGGAVKGFKQSLQDDPREDEQDDSSTAGQGGEAQQRVANDETGSDTAQDAGSGDSERRG